MCPLLLGHHFSTLLWLAEESMLMVRCASREEEERTKNGREASFIQSGLHIIIRVGRELWRFPSPTSPLKHAPYSMLHRKASRWDLNISIDSTASLGTLFQCCLCSRVTLKVNKFILMFQWNFLCSILHPLSFVLLLGTPRSVCPHTFDSDPLENLLDIYKDW